MLVTHQRLDLEACQRRGPELFAFTERKTGEIWLVSHDAIRMDKPIEWRQHIRESHVCIPLVPYLLKPEPDLALAYMLQLGMRCTFDLGRPVKRLHIVTGVPVHDVWDDEHGRLWQYHVGFGVTLED